MCGIFGFYPEKNSHVTGEQIQDTFIDLLSSSTLRGKDASGFAVFTPNLGFVFKGPLNGKKLSNFKGTKELFRTIAKEKIITLLGHTRLATNGSPLVAANNHPIQSRLLTAIHNGIVTNHEDLQKKYLHSDLNESNDSVVFLNLIEKFYHKNDLQTSVTKAYKELVGSASMAIRANDSDELILSTNTGSLYYIHTPGFGWWFASQKDFLYPLLTDSNQPITRLESQTGILFSGSKKPLIFSLTKIGKKNKKTHATTLITPLVITPNLEGKPLTQTPELNTASKLKKHRINTQKIQNIVRCTKCILPYTTPFISFDELGVCNYCRNHVKISNKGTAALEEKIAKYRRTDGKPDCIVAFSGGRDSSYGLHYIKNVLGLNPIAFTYDWGMISDIGRRNQARMLGALGVEQVVVSAHLPTKREYIKHNILAWMKKPELGMIPLFMEGDKICEYYADELMKKYDIKLMFFCRGNELEKEEFKTGHCGVKNADPGGVIHHLHWLGKLQLAWYYATQYLKNPAYLNSSFFDAAAAFIVTYLQKHDYIYLWHYVPWDEETIISTLKKEYNWETKNNGGITWRIDDGSPAFYNYIYYSVQGFTENDSFRSHQIREGKIDRKTALKLVEKENQPRYDDLAWYFNQVGLDGDEVLARIDSMPKLYDTQPL